MPKRIAILAFLASLALAVCAPASAAQATDAKASAARVDFQIKIPRVLRMQIQGVPRMVAVTQDDVERGEVVVRGVQIALVANERRGFRLRTELTHAAFSALTMTGLAAEVRVQEGSAITWMPATVEVRQAQPVEVEYRLRLAAGTTPGHYAWPVTLTMADA